MSQRQGWGEMSRVITLTLDSGAMISALSVRVLRMKYIRYQQDGLLRSLWKSGQLECFERESCSQDPENIWVREFVNVRMGAGSRRFDLFDEIIRRNSKQDTGLSDAVRQTFSELEHTVLLGDENADFWRCLSDETEWNTENVRIFFELFVLLLQLANEMTVRISEKETELFLSELRGGARVVVGGSRICPVGDDSIYLLPDTGILERVRYEPSTGDVIRCPAEEIKERICSFARTEIGEHTVRWMVVKANGSLSESRTAREIWDLWNDCGRPKLTAVAAYGEMFQMLTESGISIRGGGERWEHVHRIGAGLNAVTAICGRDHILRTNVEEINRHVKDIRNVRDARIRNNRKRIQAFVLQEQGKLFWFDGAGRGEIEGVEMATLGEKAIYYLSELNLCSFRFGEKEPVGGSDDMRRTGSKAGDIPEFIRNEGITDLQSISENGYDTVYIRTGADGIYRYRF
ncbi:MAG: hypothetical protein LUE19_01330 [Clostridiales bacterium]|nr:hypothetical protein [Clostridiales bacterium]